MDITIKVIREAGRFNGLVGTSTMDADVYADYKEKGEIEFIPTLEHPTRYPYGRFNLSEATIDDSDRQEIYFFVKDFEVNIPDSSEWVKYSQVEFDC